MILHNATADTILERRSVRSYAPQQITQDELETILEAGRFAPSGMNQQSAIAVPMPCRCLHRFQPADSLAGRNGAAAESLLLRSGSKLLT